MTTIAAAPRHSPTSKDDRPVAVWLLVCCAMIFAMAVIGAITRLTESGLSIMEWAPLEGILPPLSAAEWQRIFGLYRQIPEYREVNPGMTLSAFKTIFWWEYVHRLWGRLIALVFLVPFLWFLLRGRLRRPLLPHLLAVFAFGALQGVLGWYMVTSGLAGGSDVSQYRLVAHLTAAVVIYGYILWVALGLMRPAPPISPDGRARALRRALIGFAGLVGLTLASGGFVAGLNAGLAYNSFPLMDGEFLPAGYAALRPWARNLFENVAAVQFNHRVLALSTAAAALILGLWARRLALAPQARGACALVFAAAGLQLALGVAALLLVVPVWLGALHQAGALALLTFTLIAIHRLTPGGAQPAARRFGP
ncbi:MAG: COX15/CtaA family protein [Kiloniellaceae bacterium]